MDWKTANTDRSEDGDFFAEINRNGVMIKQWGKTRVKAFDGLYDMIAKMDKTKRNTYDERSKENKLNSESAGKHMAHLP